MSPFLLPWGAQKAAFRRQRPSLGLAPPLAGSAFAEGRALPDARKDILDGATATAALAIAALADASTVARATLCHFTPFRVVGGWVVEG